MKPNKFLGDQKDVGMVEANKVNKQDNKVEYHHIPHNDSYISSCNCLKFGASFVGMVMWDGGTLLVCDTQGGGSCYLIQFLP